MRGILAIGALALMLAGCAATVIEKSGGTAAHKALARPSAPGGPTALSLETAAYYRAVERSLLARGQMRTDGGDHDAPFTTRDLVENFLQIALYTEYADEGGHLVAQATANRLQRWDKPVRIHVMTGPSVSPERATRDRANIAHFAARLSRITGLPISMTSGTGNFDVLILSEDERRAFGPELARLMPGLSHASTQAIVDMSPSDYCLVVATTDDKRYTYIRALAVIRAEHPDLMRLSCIHEEVAQGLGLANDSPRARPSIFNDDEEFALLTHQDVLMLKILYDPRLRPGMTEAEARPIVETIARELMGGGS